MFRHTELLPLHTSISAVVREWCEVCFNTIKCGGRIIYAQVNEMGGLVSLTRHAKGSLLNALFTANRALLKRDVRYCFHFGGIILDPCSTNSMPAISISGKCFVIVNQNLNWAGALRNCRSTFINGTLAEPTNGLDTNDLEMKATIDFVASLELKNSVWIGANDLAVEGHFVWPSDNSAIKNSTLWAEGQPDDKNTEDCVWIWYKFNVTKHLNDAPCSTTVYSLCQTDTCSSIFPGAVYGYGQCFKYFDQHLSCQQANEACLEMNSHLAEPETVQMQQLLQIYMDNRTGWIGATDLIDQQTFRWLTSNNTVYNSFTFTFLSEGAIVDGHFILWTYLKGGTVWSARTGLETHGFVCQKAAVSSNPRLYVAVFPNLSVKDSMKGILQVTSSYDKVIYVKFKVNFSRSSQNTRTVILAPRKAVSFNFGENIFLNSTGVYDVYVEINASQPVTTVQYITDQSLTRASSTLLYPVSVYTSKGMLMTSYLLRSTLPLTRDYSTDIKIEDIMQDGPYLNHCGRYIKQVGPYLKQDGPYLNHRGPYLKQGGPYLNHRGLYLKQGDPYLNHCGPYLNCCGPYLKQNGPYLKQDGPYLKQGGPYLKQDHTETSLTVTSLSNETTDVNLVFNVKDTARVVSLGGNPKILSKVDSITTSLDSLYQSLNINMKTHLDGTYLYSTQPVQVLLAATEVSGSVWLDPDYMGMSCDSDYMCMSCDSDNMSMSCDSDYMGMSCDSDNMGMSCDSDYMGNHQDVCVTTLLPSSLWRDEYQFNQVSDSITATVYIIVDVSMTHDIDTGAIIVAWSCQNITGTSYSGCYSALPNTITYLHLQLTNRQRPFGAYVVGSSQVSTFCHPLGITDWIHFGSGNQFHHEDYLQYLADQHKCDNKLGLDQTGGNTGADSGVSPSLNVSTTVRDITTKDTATPAAGAPPSSDVITNTSSQGSPSGRDQADAIFAFLKVQRQSLSSFKRTLTSAPDPRLSVMVCGFTGVAIVSSVFILLTMGDLINGVRFVVSLIHRR
ncbi:hypothetical protein Btru_063089 [Bulinus truncatus]|nr:hypothetical protein Btru_063089 [Bulinus truncatus]